MEQTAKYETNMAISKVVKHLLLAAEEPRTRLAEVLGCHPKTIGRRLSGMHEWTAWEVSLMAEHFDVPVARFYEGPEVLRDWLTLGAGPSDHLRRSLSSAGNSVNRDYRAVAA